MLLYLKSCCARLLSTVWFWLDVPSWSLFEFDDTALDAAGREVVDEGDTNSRSS